MHIQIVTYQLKGMSEEEYLEASKGDTEVLAALPGLRAKIWLRDPSTNTYGGLYLWQDRESSEEFTKGEIFTSLFNDPTLENVSARDFDAIESLTKETQPLLTVV